MSYNKVGEGSSSSTNRQHLDSRKGKGKYPANQYNGEENPLILPSSFSSPSQPYGATSSQETQPDFHNDPVLTRRSQRKTCTYIAISITTCSVIILFALLWFAPAFAERSVKDGVGFSFQKASILNVTDDNVITMHVIGKIELEPSLFNLQQKFNSLFGTIGTQQSALNVYYQKSSTSTASTSSMGKIDLPALDLNGVSSVTGFDFITEFIIDDTNALMEFCKDAVIAETIMWRVSGPLTVNLGWLPWRSNVDLDKTIALEGMSIFIALCSISYSLYRYEWTTKDRYAIDVISGNSPIRWY